MSGNIHWTHPFHGVTHGYMASKPSLAERWATISCIGSVVRLDKFNPGFKTKEETFDSIEAAKASAESWIVS